MTHEPRWESVGPVLIGGRAHSAYREPSGWVSPPMCHPDRQSAEERARSLTLLAGADAAHRRAWRITPCDGSTDGCPWEYRGAGR